MAGVRAAQWAMDRARRLSSLLLDTQETEERIRYYLGNVNSARTVRLDEAGRFRRRKVHVIDRAILRGEHDLAAAFPVYCKEMRQYYRRFWREHPQHRDKRLLFVPGDLTASSEAVPFFAKTRPVTDKGLNVLLPLNVHRHWHPVSRVKKFDLPSRSKEDVMVWRGASTGRFKRAPLVEKYHAYPGPELDVGFTNFTEHYPGRRSAALLKDNLSLRQMLRCRFLISVEGHDVASNLKWIMASNSVCVRPHSKIEGWFMEGRLLPWVHYVPVADDFSDLLDVYRWCVTHARKCEQIVENANRYVARFMSRARERHIVNRVFERYASLVEVS